MKRFFALSLSMVLLLSLYTFTNVQTVSAYGFTGEIPNGIVCIAKDSFDNNSGEIMAFTTTDPDGNPVELYTGGTGFVGTWKADLALTTDPAYLGDNKGSYSAPGYLVNTSGEYVIKGRKLPIYRKLAEPVNLGIDAEYYLTVTMLTDERSSPSHYFRLGNSGKENVISFGERKDNSGSFNAITSTMSIETGTAKQFDSTFLTPADRKTYTTTVLHVSARESAPDTYRIRHFVHKPGEELPSFNPSYWDFEALQDSASANGILDTVNLFCNNNAGSGSVYTYKVDEIGIYKAAPIFLNKSTPGGEAAHPQNAQTFTEVGNLLEYDINEIESTLNSLGHAQQVVSTKWIDCTDAEAPVTLSEDTAYTVPSEMERKKLKSEIVIKDLENDELTTYVPYLQYVSSPYEVEALYFHDDSKNKPRYTAPPPVGENKIVGARVVIKRTNSLAEKQIASASKAFVLLAQYSEDGMITNLIVNDAVDLALNPGTARTVDIALTGIDIAEGDYFKSFAFYGNENLKPIRFSQSMGGAFIVNSTLLELNKN